MLEYVFSSDCYSADKLRLKKCWVLSKGDGEESGRAGNLPAKNIHAGIEMDAGLIDWQRLYCFRRRQDRRNDPRHDGWTAVENRGPIRHPHPCSW